MHPFVLTFIILTFLAGTGMLFLLQVRGYRKRILLPAAGAVLLSALASLFGILIFNPALAGKWDWLPGAMGSTYVWAVGSLGAMALMFMRDPVTAIKTDIRRFQIPPVVLLAIASILVGVFSLAVRWTIPAFKDNQVVLVIPQALGVIVPAGGFVFSLIALYTLETTYRAAGQYQRKIGRLVFVSLGTLAAFQLIFTTRVLLFRDVTQSYVYAMVAVSGVCLPMALLGLFRYRLGVEKISVSRETVYSSLTFFLAGSILLGLGIVVFIGNRIGVGFNQFEVYLAIFASAFVLVLTVTSGDFRIRLIRFLNTRLYQQKYDYREQFFRLHRTYMGGDNVHASITDLVENMKYAVTVEDAFVFLRNTKDGNFYIHENAEFSTDRNMVVLGESPLVAAFEKCSVPLVNNGRADNRVKKAFAGESHLIGKLGIGAVFPILHENTLSGILAIRTLNENVVDDEDVELINVFTLSIGSVIFKERILRERIERKQFESFSHVASFIIHDIKNQVSTLSLLSSNAHRNIANPQFQQSLLRSLHSCTSNLQKLVDRLAAPPKEQDLSLAPTDINTVVEEVVENTGLLALGDIQLHCRLHAVKKPVIHAQSFFYVIKNLVTNALEAMDNRGGLTITTGEVTGIPQELSSVFRISDTVLSSSRAFIAVEDTGKGMSGEFIEKRLFHPFSSTKDKGVGIGLYQCKTLIEKMGGRILVHSDEQKGTVFCVIV